MRFIKSDLVVQSAKSKVVGEPFRKDLWKRSTGLTDLPVQVHLGIPVARQFKSNFLESF